MMKIKCIKDFTEKGKDGKEYLYKKGEVYDLQLVGHYSIGHGPSQAVIRNRIKFYKHFMVL